MGLLVSSAKAPLTNECVCVVCICLFYVVSLYAVLCFAVAATIYVRYTDSDFRIMQDSDGEYFVYTRPVFSRL